MSETKRDPHWSALGHGNTRPGNWLKRHGWTLERTVPHGFATTHYWRSPEGELNNQTYALIDQRARNKAAKKVEAHHAE